MITINYSSKQELYDLIFDMSGAGHEWIKCPVHLAHQYLTQLDDLVHYESGQLWRMNAWKVDYAYWSQQKAKSSADSIRWNLMKEAARELHRGKLKLEYELAWQLVQDLCKKKGRVFFDAVGLTGEKWKGLME